MVVDDESDLTLYYRMSLEYYGYEVETYNESRKALSSFRPDYYDLIMLDIKMPEMNGFELIGKIRQIDDKTKICFMTAYEEYYNEFKRIFPDLQEENALLENQ